MGKRFLTMLTLLLMSVCLVSAQNSMNVSGTVISADDNEPVIGASVIVVGTNRGTITDIDGNFIISDLSPENELTISYVGMKPQTVRVAPNLKILMQSDSEVLQDVVVTALNISRDKKSLGYSVQNVSGDDLTRTSPTDVTAALNGKVAGLQITSAGGQLGASSRITIRGSSSFADNTPLIVVDGVPMSNSSTTDNNVDYGTGLSAINPDDIESISVLKGGSAALYGMRAGNGVILITTKSGRSNDQGINVTYNGSFTVDNMYNFPRWQNEYGQGTYGDEYNYNLAVANGYSGSYADFATGGYGAGYGFKFVDGAGGGVNDGNDESWGPRLDIGLKIPQFDSPVVDGVRQATDWSSHPDNVKSFFKTGWTTQHDIALVNKGSKGTTRASLGYRTTKGTVPHTDQSRYTAGLNTIMNIRENLQFDLSVIYSYTHSDNLPMGGYHSGNAVQQMFQWFGRQIDMNSLKENATVIDEMSGRPYNWNYNYHTNPYYIYQTNKNGMDRYNMLGKSSINWSITDYLRLSGILGYDHYDLNTNSQCYYSTDYLDGMFQQIKRSQTELNADVRLTFNKTFGQFSVQAMVGANYRDLKFDRLTEIGEKLIVPGLYTTSNAIDKTATMDHKKIRENSVYGNASLGWKSQLYLDITARNDWSSTINDPFFYPSFSGSWIVTESFPNIVSPSVLSFLKLRAGYAEIGSATDAYRLGRYYNATDNPISGVNQFYNKTTYPADDLRPENIKNVEAGFEVAFLNNRLRLDASYYSKSTTDQIMSVSIASSTGYNYMYVNAGKVTNKGFELSLTGDIFRTTDFTWTTTVNWSRDKSKVVSLYPDENGNEQLDSYNLGGVIYALPGESFGMIRGTDYARDEQGRIMLQSNGRPKTVSDQIIGSTAPQWLASWRNDFFYKDFSLGFLFDMRKGGDIFDQYNWWYAVYSGLLDVTTANNIREDGVIPGVNIMQNERFVDANGNEVNADNPVTVEAMYWFKGQPQKYRTYDGSFIKLREINLTYEFPKQLLQKTNFFKRANVSFIASNVAILWLHKSNQGHFDPEGLMGTGNSYLGRAGTSYPPSRSFGLKLSATF